MVFSDLFMIVPNPFLSGVLWFVTITVLLYFARVPAHRAILAITRVLHFALRLGANAAIRTENRLELRNREVLLAAGREATERRVEREFDRIDAAVRKDLAEFPALHRTLSEKTTQMEEDHQSSTEVPPTPPGWVKAVDAVAAIPAKGDPMVGEILEGIHGSLVNAHKTAIDEYRKSTQERHAHLKKMLPEWRKLDQTLGTVDKKIHSLLQRTQAVDRHMDNYEEITRGTDRAVRMLSSSSMIQFFIAGLVLAVAVGGAVINFHLIARPMAEMVGGTAFVGSFKISEIAALVIILVEISMGLFLMESLRVTQLFPVIGSLPDKIRMWMGRFAFFFLFALASVEAGLAYMREILMQDELATSALLRGDGEASFESLFLWITTSAQMGMGFILPFALVFVAIPLENFIHSLRTVLGFVLAAFLRGLAMALRLIGNVFRYGGHMLVNVYDLLIFAPLWIEAQLTNGSRGSASKLATMKETS
jgi:hypothetical protein